jgi:type IV secretory pathway component VirB8
MPIVYFIHMEPELAQRFAALEEKVGKIYISVEKTRKYFLWTMIISVAFVVLPAIGLIFVIPQFLNSYLGSINAASAMSP